MTGAFREAFGEGGDPLPFRVWVLVHDVSEGSWGAGGRTVSAFDVAQFIGGEVSDRRRAEITEALGRRR